MKPIISQCIKDENLSFKFHDSCKFQIRVSDRKRQLILLTSYLFLRGEDLLGGGGGTGEGEMGLRSGSDGDLRLLAGGEGDLLGASSGDLRRGCGDLLRLDGDGDLLLG